MGRIRAERAEVETRLPVAAMMYFYGETGLNMHGMCRFRFLLEANTGEESVAMAQGSGIVVRERGNNEETAGLPVFAGIIDDIMIEKAGGNTYAEVKGVSYSILMDKEKKKRSFQDINLSYYDIARQIVEEYDNAGLVWNLDRDEKIGRPLIQYQETDWELLMRLSSHLHGGIFADESQGCLKLYAGVKENGAEEEIDDYVWEYGFSHLRNDIYYLLKRRENRRIGDGVIIDSKKYIIMSKEVTLEKGELMFCYKAGTKASAEKDISYNERFRGLQLEGTVDKAEGESVCVRLDIDGSRSQVLYPYPWTPNTGNIFYCMPEPGTKVYLRFTGKDEREAVVIDSIRTNGGKCGGYADPQNRVFETAEKKMMKLFSGELAFCGNKSGGMPEISLKDTVGAELKSQGTLVMEARGNISLSASELQCGTPVGIIQCASGSNMEIHQDFNLYSPAGLNSIHVETDVKEDEEQKGRRGIYTPCWEGAYTAIGAIASFGKEIGETTSLEMASAAGIPSVGGGKAVSAMAEAVNGIPAENIRYSKALRTVKVDVLNGGYPLPKRK